MASCFIPLIILVCITALSVPNVSDAGGFVEGLKLRKGLKLSYYNTEADALDLPTIEAYDLHTSPSITFAPLAQGYDNSLLAPSPVAQSPSPNAFATAPSPQTKPNLAPSPELFSGYGTITPSPLAQSPTSNSVSMAPASSPPPLDPRGAQLGPTHSNPIATNFAPAPPMGPQPAAAPSHRWGSKDRQWCVARPTVPEPLLQKAMDYACGTGADCGSIQPKGLCFAPNNLVAHASYAFNSYWQKTKIVGGSCDFGGTAMLITVDPSFGGCNFVHE